MICLLKRYCLIGQSGWREIRDAFPVIRWVVQNKDLGAAWKNKPWLEYTCYAAYVADVDGDSEASWQTMQSPVYKKLFTSKDNSTSNDNVTAHWKDWKWLLPVQNLRLCHWSIPGRPGQFRFKICVRSCRICHLVSDKSGYYYYRCKQF